jgi:dienelactone hydrolase
MDMGMRSDADELRFTEDLRADVRIPSRARGLVVFVHGGGLSRDNPRNHELARRLAADGLGTLLVDLLSTREAERARLEGPRGADTGFLAARLGSVTEELARRAETRRLHVGYFAAGSGAAPAFVAAADRPHLVGAILCRGGRVDLAGGILERVLAPTLLVVGANDQPLREINERAFARLRCEKRLRIAPRATRLFEAPGAFEAVAGLASTWFGWFLRDELVPGAIHGGAPSLP